MAAPFPDCSPIFAAMAQYRAGLIDKAAVDAIGHATFSDSSFQYYGADSLGHVDPSAPVPPAAEEEEEDNSMNDD